MQVGGVLRGLVVGRDQVASFLDDAAFGGCGPGIDIRIRPAGSVKRGFIPGLLRAHFIGEGADVGCRGGLGFRAGPQG